MQRSSVVVFGILFAMMLAAGCGAFGTASRLPVMTLGCVPDDPARTKVHPSDSAVNALVMPHGLLCTASSSGEAYRVSSRLTVDISRDMFTNTSKKLGAFDAEQFLMQEQVGLFQAPSLGERKILIYINGFNGSPADWRAMYASLYDVDVLHVFYNYPTGASLETSATLLADLLSVNMESMGGRPIILLGHSQGGLVALRTVQLLAHRSARLPETHVITLASPLKGSVSASYARFFRPLSPDVVMDIAEGSRFLERLHASPLPRGMRYSLVAAIRKDAEGVSAPGDGVFAFGSQTYVPGSLKPTSVFPVYTSHRGILKDKDVCRFVRTVCTPFRSDVVQK